MADFLNSTGLTQVLQAVKRAVPTTLAALSDDATHRLVTDTEKSAWNNKADVFVAIYDSTTQDEVLTAAAAGKMVVCYYNNRLYMYAGTSTAGYCQFTSLLYDTAYRVYLKNSSWGNATMDIPTDVVKYTSQSLLDSQKTQARTNIGAGTYSKPETGIPENDLSESVQDKLNGPMERGSGQNSAKQIGSGANALGDSSFAENSGKASGLLSHAEGNATTARGGSSHAEGSDTTASGNSSHAEGQGTIASGNGSHAEGVGYNDIYTTAGADSAHAEGAGVVVKGQAAHGEGLLNVAGRTQEEAVAALADFHNLSGTTEQKVSKLIGFASHSEGSSTRALGTSSHAEGNSTQALVNATHAEGDSTTASGEAAHSEGYNTTASGNQAHAEGYHTEATANQAHAEGKYTEATSENAHAEGNHTTANGNASHTEGYYTVANNNAEHAEGQYNVSNKASTTFGNAGNTIHSVGIGTSNARKNAFEIMQNGDAYLLGIGGYNGKNYSSASTLQSVLSNIPSAVTDSTVSGWGYIKSYTETDPIFSASPAAGITASDITGWNNKVSNVQADWDATTGLGVILNKPAIPTTYAGSPTAGGFANKAVAIPFGNVDSDSTATNIKATVDNFPAELTPGVCAYIRNDVIASANGWTLNINGTGALPVYQTLADATRTSTIFSAATTHLFVYNPTRVKGGCWDIFYGYNSNDNTIGYNLRTNAMSLPVTSACYRYRLLFTSADKAYFVPANASTSTNATTKRNTTQTPIDPFGSIRYYSATSAVSSGNRPSASYLWEQYSITLGYSFNRTGAALTLTAWKPVYIKCAPQADGSAIIEAETPYVQNLPTTADGKIYIFLGVATAATTVEMVFHHPVYYHDGTKVTNWLGPVIGDIQTALDAIIGKSLNSFTIGGTTYQAEDGMTWEDWVDSEYNTGNYFIFTGDDTLKYITKGSTGQGAIMYGQDFVRPGETIIEDGVYQSYGGIIEG